MLTIKEKRNPREDQQSAQEAHKRRCGIQGVQLQGNAHCENLEAQVRHIAHKVGLVMLYWSSTAQFAEPLTQSEHGTTFR